LPFFTVFLNATCGRNRYLTTRVFIFPPYHAHTRFRRSCVLSFRRQQIHSLRVVFFFLIRGLYSQIHTVEIVYTRLLRDCFPYKIYKRNDSNNVIYTPRPLEKQHIHQHTSIYNIYTRSVRGKTAVPKCTSPRSGGR